MLFSQLLQPQPLKLEPDFTYLDNMDELFTLYSVIPNIDNNFITPPCLALPAQGHVPSQGESKTSLVEASKLDTNCEEAVIPS